MRFKELQFTKWFRSCMLWLEINKHLDVNDERCDWLNFYCLLLKNQKVPTSRNLTREVPVSCRVVTSVRFSKRGWQCQWPHIRKLNETVNGADKACMKDKKIQNKTKQKSSCEDEASDFCEDHYEFARMHVTDSTHAHCQHGNLVLVVGSESLLYFSIRIRFRIDEEKFDKE